MKIYISPIRDNRALITAVLFCFMLIIQSCNRLSVSTTPSQTPLPSFTPTFEYAESSDCLWRGTGRAWNDDNQNGVWDLGEKPLANVKFWVDDPLNDYQKVNDGLYSDTTATNADGNVEIVVGLPGCPDVEFEVYTEIPVNCELTTQERISVNFNTQSPVYSFGFVCV